MKKTGKYVIVFNSVSANVVHDARNDAGVASAGCSAPRTIIKNGLRVFERGENLLQNIYYTCQKSCCNARI